MARSDPQIWEINKKNASKGKAIHELAQKLNINDTEVMIFGDQAMICQCLKLLALTK